MTSQLVRISEAAGLLSVSAATLRAKVKTGEIPGRRLGKGHFRIHRAWLDRMVREDGPVEKDTPQAA